ncbi:MAG: hypothetical protein QOF21_1130, partial [Actinomycetota bacterium]
QHPEVIERVILDSTYARGEDLGPPEMRESVLATVKLMQSQPGMAATMLGYYTHPDAGDRTRDDRRFQLGREAINADAASALYTLSFDLDVSKDFIGLRAPALVTHRRASRAVKVELGRRVAALVPDAIFVAQEGRQTNPWDDDATAVLETMGEFLHVPLTDGYFPRVTVRPTVILFSDIVNSTGVTSSLGDSAAHEIVRAFHAISRQCLETRGGRLIKSMGDGVMAEFPSVSQALGCAVDLQLAFAAFAADHAERPMSVRIGINAGEPVSDDDDLHGLVVSTTSRICDQGEGGDIIVSNVVRELAVGKGFTFEDRGAAALKGVGEPVHLYRVAY